MIRRNFILQAVCVLIAMPLLAAPTHDFGFCYASWSEGGSPASRWEAAGPLLEFADSGTDQRFAFRPFFSREKDARGRSVVDVLWPIASFRSWQGGADWRILTVMGHDHQAADSVGAYRLWALPVFFLGRNRAGEDYGAVFPLGGRIDDWFGRDQVSFVLFPLYARSRLNDLQTVHVLWPLISRTSGKGVEQGRVFPLYGYSRRANAMEHSFILWPIWTRVQDRRPGRSGSGFMLFPIFGHARMEDHETWMWIPPLFRHTRGKHGTSGACPWPLVQWETGERDKLYVWPLYGRRSSGGDTVSFWAWPFVWKGKTENEGVLRDRFRVFPLYSQESRRVKEDGGPRVSERYVSVWPLVSYDRRESNTMVRMLDLWPFRDTAPIERNLSPWWTLFSRYRTDRGTGGKFLWGLARWSSTQDGKRYRSLFPLVSTKSDAGESRFHEWDVFKGAVGYRRDASGASYRLLYFLRWRSRR